ncbi:MAG TPA: hypothetical protein VIK47_03680 [Kiloniellales bacterium]
MPTIRQRAEETAKAVFDAAQIKPTPEQTSLAVRAIEQGLIRSYRDATDRCAKVAKTCCSEDLDMAHKIAEEMKRANAALIANLSGMR